MNEVAVGIQNMTEAEFVGVENQHGIYTSHTVEDWLKRVQLGI